jgi:pyruvate dehydrogenase E1 component beta subunit
MSSPKAVNYGEALCAAFDYLLGTYPEVFVIGQGLWSPWYVGNSMKDIDKKFGVERVIDTPVSEDGCTGAAIGASLCGMRPIVIHPRVDFMILATDQIVNQAAKWSYMLGGQAHPAVTIRGIVNRGGEQGAQHSQALHAWFAHVPGLRVVMPASVRDARELLVASVLCDDPVLFIDDRWCYDQTAELPAVEEWDLAKEGPRVVRKGSDITIVGASYPVTQALQAADELAKDGIDCEVIDLRVIAPLKHEAILKSVAKTGRLCVVDGGNISYGMTGEIIARVYENLSASEIRGRPLRLATPDTPAPTSKILEAEYYHQISAAGIKAAVQQSFR